MWKNVFSKLSGSVPLLATEACLKQQTRSTFVLKRKYPPRLHRKGCAPKRMTHRQYVYELVADTDVLKQPNIDVILTSVVDGIGNAGETVSVKPLFAYNNLILPQLAVYASPENVEKYKNVILETSQKKGYSSVNVPLMIGTLSRMTLSVVMNKENPWCLEPWHVSTSFRKCGYIVPKEAITLPEKPIKGPNIDLEGKEFYVTVTINKCETTNVRCRIHHWSTDVTDRLPFEPEFWLQKNPPIYPEFENVLKQLARHPGASK